MFWRFGGYATTSTIDTLLDKSDVTLEELLDETDLTQELKQHNTKLIEFLRDENTLQRLLKYVVAPGPPVKDEDNGSEDDKERTPRDKGKGKDLSIKTSATHEQNDEELEKAEKLRLKYAYVACEVLALETWSILESLMANIAHLQEFWEFLKQPPPLDPLQAGYFTKVNETLLEKKTEEMLDFFKTSPGMIAVMLKHVDCPMVMDLLLKIISLEKAEGGQGIVDWLQSQDLIPNLLAFLSPDSPSSTQTSAGDFLKAIITISANASQNEQSCIGPNSLTRQLVSENCMQSLITSMLHGGNPLTVGVGIVIEVIRKNNSDYDPENGHNPDTPPTNHDPIYLGTLLRMFAKHVPDFMELILSSNHTVTDGDTTRVKERGKLSSAWGTEIEPLGFDRFKTCELMAELLHCSNMGLLNERGGEQFIRQRDVERDRLREAGAFISHKEEDDSAVDVSEESTGYANGNASMVDTSTEELRIANSSEEDGFEKVAAPGKGDDTVLGDDSTTSDDAFTEIQDRSKFELSDDLVDEPLSPRQKSLVETIDADEAPSSPTTEKELSPSTPTTSGLEEKVRRVSLDDNATPPLKPEIIESPEEMPTVIRSDTMETKTLEALPEIGKLNPKTAPNPSPPALSPHPEDTPAPLFSKSTTPKSPTPPQPESAVTPPASLEDVSGTKGSLIEGDTSVYLESTISAAMPTVETEADGSPVVGDHLKIMFVENKVVPTILGFFFRFPWNNFLHNVVYDVVQQVFNGPMDRGFNRSVAVDLFETGSITEQIVEGQRRSDEAQQKKNMRLGYMGHLTLVAEEVVKFSERHPPELLSQAVMDKVLEKAWIDYVEMTLSETRERDNAILGGVRPDLAVGPRQAVLNAVNASQGIGGSHALANAGLNGGIGGQQGLDNIDLSNNGSGTSAFASGSASLLSGFGSSSDDDDEDMDEAEEEDSLRAAIALSTADTGDSENSDTPIPLIPPPPAPLNIPPSRARRQLAARLALQKQRADEAAIAGEEEAARRSQDPFASLGDQDDDGNGSDPFTLDEEEEDITASGRRAKKPQVQLTPAQKFSVSRGIQSLFSGYSTNARDEDIEDEPLGSALFPRSDEAEGGSASDDDDDDQDQPSEVATTPGRKPLEIDEEEDEMGEMVAPSEEADDDDEDVDADQDGPNSSDDEDELNEVEESEALSPVEKERLRGNFSGTQLAPAPLPVRLLHQRQKSLPEEKPQDDDTDDSGEGLVEIAMPNSGSAKAAK